MSKMLLLVLAVTVSLLTGVPAASAFERSDGGFYTVYDENGAAVLYTGWKIQPGDQFLDEKNHRYEIVKVEGDRGSAIFIGTVDLAVYMEPEMNLFVQGWISLPRAYAQTPAGGGRKVAIYHTPTDESYVPTDGRESIRGDGGIFAVGKSFADSLQAKGVQATQNTTHHDPHDDMAYERSRRTLAGMLKQQRPDAVFDIHRDAVPPQVYQANIDGREVSKIQLVVGKYGTTGKQIEDYALKIKGTSDKKHPGLVKGIFFAKGGDYNQDLHPRSMLLEAGSHTNSREQAEKGIALFADAIPSILGQTAGSPAAPSWTTGFGSSTAGPSGASKSIGWIIGLLVAGIAAFLFISTGSFKEAGAKLKRFTSSEFANFLGPKLRRRKRRDGRDGEGNN